MKFIFGVDTMKRISVSPKTFDKLVDKDLIHFTGNDWVYFEDNTKLIEETIAEENAKTDGWINLTLEQIILEYRDSDEDPEPLDGDAVDDLVRILKAKINLHEGNITPDEYNKILG